MNLAAAVKTTRLERGMSQTQLAERAGVTQGAIAHVEGGRRIPSTQLLEKLARGLDISLPELITRAESARKEQEISA